MKFFMFVSRICGYEAIKIARQAQRIYGDLESKFEILECNKRFPSETDPSKPDLSRPGFKALGVRAVDETGEDILRKTLKALEWKVEEVDDLETALNWAERPFQEGL